MKVAFKAKVETLYNMDNTVAYQRIKIPTLGRTHCDMEAFRRSKEFGPYANSDLFKGILAGIRNRVSKTGYIRLDQLPKNVTVEGDYIAKVEIEIEDKR